MQLKQESCVAAIDADWARTACSAIVSGVVGRSASKQSSIQVRTRGAGGWRRPKSRRPRLLQMDVFAFSQRPSTTSRGHTRPAVLFAGKCLMSQYAWHCLIYSGAYLFQLHGIRPSCLRRQAHCQLIIAYGRLGPQGWMPRAFLPFPSLPTAHTARADGTD